MSEGLTPATIHALRDAILKHEDRRPGIARQLVIERVQALPLTNGEWMALLTLVEIFEAHRFSLEIFRALVAVLEAAQPGSAE